MLGQAPERDNAVPARKPRGSAFRFQRGLGECIELCDGGARDPEDLPPAASERDPRFERGDALRAEAFEERQRQFGRQAMRHTRRVFGNRGVCQAEVNIMLCRVTGSVTRVADHAAPRRASPRRR
jgi:hypothetical protein